MMIEFFFCSSFLFISSFGLNNYENERITNIIGIHLSSSMIEGPILLFENFEYPFWQGQNFIRANGRYFHDSTNIALRFETILSLFY